MNREQAKMGVFAMREIFGFNEKEAQEKCLHCNEEYLENETGGDLIPEFGKGYAIEHGDIVSFIKKKDGKYYLGHDFTPDDGYFFENGNQLLSNLRQKTGGLICACTATKLAEETNRFLFTMTKI